MEKLETLARQMMLTPSQAVALPATLDRASAMVGMTREQMVAACSNNPSLREYLASVCRQVVA